MPTDDRIPDPTGATSANQPAGPRGADASPPQAPLPEPPPPEPPRAGPHVVPHTRPRTRRIIRLGSLRSLGRLGLPLSIAAALVALTIASFRVASRFEAREREAPTRLYGRAAALRPCVLLPADELVARLERLGYRRTRGEPKAPGEYRVSRAVSVRLRSFETARGTVAPRALRIHWDDRRIEWVEDVASGDAVDDAVLPPEVVATLYGPIQEDRTVLPLSEFPRDLIDAVLVTEDRRFYRHHGIDPIGIARAAVTNASSGAIKQGGSTLTQQLAKNLFFDQQRTLSRKAVEAVTAVLLETRYPKDRILQAYLNEVYLGQRGAVSIKGFARAATFYFGKDVGALDLAESATLAGLIRAPGLYNPFLHPERAVERRDQVLAAMEKEKRITAQQRRTAQAKPLKPTGDRQATPTPRAVAYLADYARQIIAKGPAGSAAGNPAGNAAGNAATTVDRSAATNAATAADRNTARKAASDPSRAGLRIFTTIDPTLQRYAEDALARGIAQLERSYRALRRRDVSDMLQGAIVVLDPRDGAVLAMVGGRDYDTSQFNRVTQAHRPPGSLFKPFVYLAGYEAAAAAGSDDEVFTPATLLEDEPLQMRVAGKQWAPANYDGEFRGPVTAQLALEQSLNVPTVRAALQIGLKPIVAVAGAAGVQSTLKPYPSLALGAQEVTPLEIAAAYATIANGGTRHDASMVETVMDASGSTLFEHRAESEPALSAAATFLVTVGLEGALDRGTGATARALGFRGTAAGKTGTTDDYRDAWFCGYTPDVLALVWIGFDDGSSLGLTGAAAALPIWVDFMRRAGAETSEAFPEPSGIAWEDVDPISGGRARWGCPDQRRMAFLEGTEPTSKCDMHGWFRKWW
jgi:penicillin-binding protein 1B